MPIDVSAETVIGRPVEAVASFAADPTNDASWIGGVVGAELVSPPPVAKGARVRRTAKFLGRTFNYVTEVTEWDPPGTLAMTATSPFPMAVRYEFGHTRPHSRAGRSERLLPPRGATPRAAGEGKHRRRPRAAESAARVSDIVIVTGAFG